MKTIKFIVIFQSLKVLSSCEDLSTLTIARALKEPSTSQICTGAVWCRQNPEVWCDLLCFVSKAVTCTVNLPGVMSLL